jgi:alcohol dehydrogenase class IV
LPHVLRFNAEAAKPGLEKLHAALGVPGLEGKALITTVTQAIEVLFSGLGLPHRLREVGVSRASLPELAEISMEDWFVRDNPRPVCDKKELQQVLENAW